jgi:hypothetical protein
MAVRDLDGTGDFVDLEGISATGAFTVIAVVKRMSNGAWHTIMSNQTSGDQLRIALSFSNGDRLAGSLHNGTAAFACNSGTGTNTFTVVAADGWVIVVWAKPAGAGSGTLSVFKGGSWTHCSPGAALTNPAAIGAGGKCRIGRFEAASDDADTRNSSVCFVPGVQLTTGEIETLDGGDAVAWDTAINYTAAGGDLWEHAYNTDGSAISAWATLNGSINGLMDATATAGNGTIVTGDDPATSIYTAGVRAGGAVISPRREHVVALPAVMQGSGWW